MPSMIGLLPSSFVLLLAAFQGRRCSSLQLCSPWSRAAPKTSTPYTRVAASVVSTQGVENNQLSYTVSKPSFDWSEQWYPAFPVSYLEDAVDPRKPISVVILGRKLVIWKSESPECRWSIFDDSCPHRRSPLSTGQVVNDGSGCSLKCRYHGWEFNSEGACSKIPMNGENGAAPQATHKTVAYPTKAVGGLLWVYLGKKSGKDVPEIPAGSLLSDEENALSSWEIFINPASYLTMVENSLDPAHAPFTHQGMNGIGGSDFSPEEALPIARYEVVETKGENNGFALVHTPYQRSAAKLVGENTTNTRTFIPPCTIVASSLPFFQIKIWFVPSTPTDTVIIGHRRIMETRMMKLTKLFPKIRSIVSDWSHSIGYLADKNYRFISQDRLTMQGQDENKLRDGRWWDLAPSTSDTGVATMQKWVRDVGGLGPNPWMNGVSPDSIPKQLSVWESHGKFCPQCQRTMTRVLALEKMMDQGFQFAFAAAGIFSLLAVGTSLIGKASKLAFLTPLSILLVVASLGCRWVSEWSKTIQRRMYGKGDESWQRRLEIFGYNGDAVKRNRRLIFGFDQKNMNVR